jgi:acyl-ACP thioesterase
VRPGPFVEHLSLDQHVLDLPGKRLAAPESTGWKHTCAVRQEDIDFNGHVTNTRYLTWIEEALLRKAGFEGLLSHLEIDFVSEVLAGEHVSVGASREGSQDAWSVLMVREEDGATVAVARVRA